MTTPHTQEFDIIPQSNLCKLFNYFENKLKLRREKILTIINKVQFRVYKLWAPNPICPISPFLFVKSTVSFQFSLKLCPRWHSLPLQTPMSVLHFQKAQKKKICSLFRRYLAPTGWGGGRGHSWRSRASVGAFMFSLPFPKSKRRSWHLCCSSSDALTIYYPRRIGYSLSSLAPHLSLGSCLLCFVSVYKEVRSLAAYI